MHDSPTADIGRIVRGQRDWLMYYFGGQTDDASSRKADVSLICGGMFEKPNFPSRNEEKCRQRQTSLWRSGELEEPGVVRGWERKN